MDTKNHWTMENGEVYNSAISSCGLAHEWPAALALMEATPLDYFGLAGVSQDGSPKVQNGRIVEDLGPPFEETSQI